MKVVALLPMKANSERVKGKNFRDFGGKLSFDYYPSPRHQLKFGLDYTFHTFTPNRAEAFSGDEAFIIDPDKKRAHELGVYLTDNWKISKVFSINAELFYFSNSNMWFVPSLRLRTGVHKQEARRGAKTKHHAFIGYDFRSCAHFSLFI